MSSPSSPLTTPPVTPAARAAVEAAAPAGLSPGVVAGIVAAVVVLLLLVALVVGLVLRRRRRISFTEQEDESAAPSGPSAGTYQAGGGFSFSAGSGGASTLDRPADDAAAEPAAPERPAHPEPPRPTEPIRPAGEGAAEEPASTPPSTPSSTSTGTPTSSGSATAAGAGTTPTLPEPVRPTEPITPTASRPGAETETETVVERPSTPEPTPPVESAPVESAPVESAPVEPAPVEPAPAAATPTAPSEEIAPSEGRLERLRGRLGRSRSTLGQGLLGLLGAGDLDEEAWEEVEDTLLLADLGSATTQEVVAKLRERIASRGVRTAEEARELLREVLVESLGPDMERSVRALAHDGRPAVVLVAGVNGTGKTTTTGKLARVLVADGFEVLLGAADTFRAAAAEQLVTWGERAGAETVRGKEGADPASVAFDAVKRGADTGVDAVLLDTAGRLHTKAGLMDELGKVKRVVERQAEVDEVLLVLDATTGQNGLTQARVFREVVDVTGVVLTKLDGTAKGGIVFQVQRELGVPVKLVGLGEGPDDLAPFEPHAFVDALLR